MNRNKYRLAGGIAGFIVLYLLIFLARKSDISSVFAGIINNTMVRTGLPGYVYMNNVDNGQEFSLLGLILNDIYPMNEYLLANEPAKTPDPLNGAGSPSSQANSDGVINITVPDETDTETQTQPESTGAEEPEPTAPPAGAESGLSVISKNAISGSVYSRENLNDYNFTSRKFYTVTSITSLTPEIFRPQEFLDKDLTMTHDASAPQILIFHTHSQETFVDSAEGDPATSIVGVGDYLTQILTEKYGYNVIHDTSVYDYVDGRLDRSKAYTYAEQGIDRILSQNPSIEVVIDLHRDGVAETTHLVTEVDGKQMARIMFFNGLSYSNVNGNIGYLYNPFRDDNLAMSLQMHLLGEAYYPGFLRNIYINAYRYCLHERGKSMLIEAGAQTNTVQEVKNAMEPLADLLDKLLRGEKAY